MEVSLVLLESKMGIMDCYIVQLALDWASLSVGDGVEEVEKRGEGVNTSELR